ncbi:MAG: transglutaminase family protein [Lachnospiraceae bacterium]|nr:transglutaminase family protein [Lachnospiraceae bacterium]
MKRLGFRYEMRLKLDQAVWDHHFLIRCRPMESARQQRERMSVKIEPADFVSEVKDGFGNEGYAGSAKKPHDSLLAVAEGVVRVDIGGTSDPVHPMYRFPSAFTMPGEDIRRFFGETRLEPGWPAGKEGSGSRRMGRKELMYMMNRLYGRFVYSPGATTVETTAEEALALGKGVCQDYAHVFISLCRLAGIPARYVAGMMLGEGASHAWVEVWLEDGWLGMDPTNNRLVDETYIKLTHGRDFRDGSIDRGRFLGFAGQSQEICVKVEEII